MRSTRETLESHLDLRRAGDLEADLEHNYADEVVLLSWGEGSGRGKDAVRRLADVLDHYLGDGRYTYEELVVEGPYALLRWSGTARHVSVRSGVDSFHVHDGRIVAQTIHYVAEDER
ncbi:ester cyclase [Cellulomonas sp. APG4]|uniref:nuclear transport factor 2 family protein n=1 Tax=Cellulomonas sp. APG4 TaxID=1538656 RepID=UPI001379D198|nr:nuclear transport factor 2 family protein [Cellulomonas sp. APG4]NCT90922.1 ester cyclase [Cellulomonas sp. APG4]